MTYQIRNLEPVVKEAKGQDPMFPYLKLEVGQGFYVPNLDLMPPGEERSQARTLKQMQSRTANENRKKSHIASGTKFTCAIYKEGTQAGRWIAIRRDS